MAEVVADNGEVTGEVKSALADELATVPAVEVTTVANTAGSGTVEVTPAPNADVARQAVEAAAGPAPTLDGHKLANSADVDNVKAYLTEHPKATVDIDDARVQATAADRLQTKAVEKKADVVNRAAKMGGGLGSGRLFELGAKFAAWRGRRAETKANNVADRVAAVLNGPQPKPEAAAPATPAAPAAPEAPVTPAQTAEAVEDTTKQS